MEIDGVPAETKLDEIFIKTHGFNYRQKFITVEDYVLRKLFLDHAKSIEEFEIFDSDVWVCGFPKTGTTWLTEIAWLVSHDLDYENVNKRFFPSEFLDFRFCFEDPLLTLLTDKFMVEDLPTTKPPRLIKTHLPFQLMPKEIRDGAKKPKVIYITRNPLDTCVSYYHMWANITNFSGTLDDFCNFFLAEKLPYTPFAKHVLSFWEVRNKPNILFLRYEDLKQDLLKVINQIALFLGKTLTNEESQQLQKHVSFKSMKANSKAYYSLFLKGFEEYGREIKTPHVRRGEVGGFKSEMPAHFIPRFQEWMRKCFEGSGLNIFDV